MPARLRRFLRPPGAASPVEYGLLAAAIVVVVTLVAFAFGSYLHHALRTPCGDGTDLNGSTTASCSVQQAH
jgi:Flp pilus assembly pilin Flp